MRQIIRSTIKSAAQALDNFTQFDEIEAAVDCIVKANAPIIISGVGKSGHVARRIASTFRSLGANAHFIHASEAGHGDLGAFQNQAIVILLSNSGKSSELSDIIAFCQSNNNPLIAITGNGESALAAAASVTICYGKIEEADPNGLAPTTSTTLAGAIGDALALAYAKTRGFSPAEFAHFHPRGRLGARLQRARDIMRVGDHLPLLDKDVDMKTLVFEMSQKALGIAILQDQSRVVGILTDGDLRRHLGDIWSLQPIDIATRNPHFIEAESFVGDAVEEMSRRGITQLLVGNENRLEGVLHLHDCIRQG